MSSIGKRKGRSIALTTVFAATVVAGISAATIGFTTEQNIDDTCAHAAWPYVPAFCLTGGTSKPVRTVSVDRTPQAGMAERFAIAFQ